MKFQNCNVPRAKDILAACQPRPGFKEPEIYHMAEMLFPNLETNTSLVRKDTAYTNHSIGITEPQRKVLKALVSGKGNFLVEVGNIKGRKRFRCLDMNRNIVGNRFNPVVVRNLVSKGYLIERNNKLYLK